MKKILIALDYDPTAQKVAEAGFSLAKTMGAEIMLLHVISDPIYYASTEYSPIMGFAGYIETGQLQLDNAEGLIKASHHFLNKTKKHLNDEAIQIFVKEGEIAGTIVKTAKSLHADVIVLGSHSRRWLENIVMGSITESVLHHSAIPLFIIPTKKRK